MVKEYLNFFKKRNLINLSMERFQRFTESSRAILAVVLFAALLRLWNLPKWSMFLDEETAIYFTQHLDMPFPKCFPLFFWGLRQWFDVMWISVGIGRIFPAVCGVLSVAIMYYGFRRILSHPVALLASLFITLNLGHLFWSQSIRYYALLLLVQLLCIAWFVEGFERGKYRSVFFAAVAFTVSLTVHFSGVLLFPALLGYLLVMILLRHRQGAHNLKGYFMFVVPCLASIAWFLPRFFAMQAKGATGAKSGVIPAHVDFSLIKLITFQMIGYHGLPLIILSALSPLLARKIPRPILLLFLAITLVPILELYTIGAFRLAFIVWYYVWFVLIGLAVLASISVVGLFHRGFHRTAALVVVISCLYYVPFFVVYHTTAYGDRPRWEEAVRYVAAHTNIDLKGTDNPELYCRVPGVACYYLGVEAGKTMGNGLVQKTPWKPPQENSARDRWFLVSERSISGPMRQWYREHCELKARFEAHLGPIDRTVLVYYQPGR